MNALSYAGLAYSAFARKTGIGRNPRTGTEVSIMMSRSRIGKRSPAPTLSKRSAGSLLRHEIDYKTPATLRDEIVLRTWVGKATRLTFERFTRNPPER